MRFAIYAVIDRRLEHLIVARLRRRAPVLHVVPTRWIVVATRPTVQRVRRSLIRRALLAAGGVAIALPPAVLLAT